MYLITTVQLSEVEFGHNSRKQGNIGCVSRRIVFNTMNTNGKLFSLHMCMDTDTQTHIHT
jgi:hypothetical protein